MQRNHPLIHTDYGIGFFPHSFRLEMNSNSFERMDSISAETQKKCFLCREWKKP